MPKFGHGGKSLAVISNAGSAQEPPAGNVNIHISGGTVRAESAAWAGPNLGFDGVEGLTVEGVTVAGTSRDCHASFLNCSDATISMVVVESPTAGRPKGLAS